MEESLNLSMQQKLQQRLTPQQVQFVRMLEMTGPEVEDEVRRAVDENPALEVSDGEPLPAEQQDDEGFNESAEQMQLADYKTEDDIPSYRLEAGNYSPDTTYYEPVVVDAGDTLIDMLTAQLSEQDLTERQLAIGEYIIGNIDDNGYLARDLMSMESDLAIQGIDVSMAELKDVFEKVRELDPAGVGAVDLRDCLLLQLRRRKQSDALAHAIEIIEDYFDLFSKKHYDKLCSMMGMSADELKDAMSIIRLLNPKPGSQVNGTTIEDKARHIVPEFSVDVDDGEITLTLLNNLPELQIEESFTAETLEQMPKPGKREREAQAFIKQKRDEAAGFIKILRMRQETLYRVMSAIVRLQRDFFLTDDESLIRPMILKDVAALTGYDLSVISRATAGKYVATAGGIYPLKLFFNERPKEDDDVSSHEILAVIKEIIAQEEKKRPLSDEAITARLVERGYDIARRTVAKYRERLGFPVARLRREIQ